MKPSEWLSTLRAADFYPESKLFELDDYGIRFDPESGTVLCVIADGYPYPPHGRRTAAPLLTERGLLAEYGKLGYAPTFKWKGNERYVIGFQVVEMVWRLLAPITIEEPPSHRWPDPENKARADLTAIREYGY